MCRAAENVESRPGGRGKGHQIRHSDADPLRRVALRIEGRAESNEYGTRLRPLATSGAMKENVTTPFASVVRSRDASGSKPPCPSGQYATGLVASSWQCPPVQCWT